MYIFHFEQAFKEQEFFPLQEELLTRRQFKELYPEESPQEDIEKAYRNFLGEKLYKQLIQNIGSGQGSETNDEENE